MGLLSALAGVRAETTPGASDQAPPAEEAHFLTALLDAFGIGANRAKIEDPSEVDISDTVRGLAMILSSASAEDGDATGAEEAGASHLLAEACLDCGVDLATVADVGFEAEPLAPTDAQGVAAAAVQEVQERLGPDEIDASLDRVHPELRDKIGTVMERMRDEFGYEVTVVEGYRSAQRQAHLYAQGRTRPGQVTTWTRQSWHTDGLAADLQVDGNYDDRLAYARLQRIAREEGLRTLGSRDLGHVEMPGSRAAGAGAPGPAGPTRRFVGVAVPAAPGAVAAVAQVATPGSWITIPAATADPAGVPAAPAPIEAPVLGMDAEALGLEVEELEVGDTQRVASRSGTAGRSNGLDAHVMAGGASARDQDDAAGDGGSEPSERSLKGLDRASAETELPGSNGVRTGRSTDGPSSAGRVASLDGPTSLDRAERIQELQELAKATQPSRIALRLGENEQLRVGLLNQSVEAELDITDPETAALLRRRVGELLGALDSRGLELGALSVNGVTGAQAGLNGWAGGQGDSAADLIRTLFASSDGTGQGRQDAERRSSNHEPGHDRAGSDRERRDARQGGDR